MKDSPNGKRWGHRDSDGIIIEAYGFDLSPLAARAAEFEALHDRMQEERQLCSKLRNALTITRRMIRAKIEKAFENRLRGPWHTLSEDFERAIAVLPGPLSSSEEFNKVLEAIKALAVRVDQAFEQAFDWPERSDASPHNEDQIKSHNDNMTPKGIESETHILTTKQLNPVKSKGLENEKCARSVPKPPDTALDEKPEHCQAIDSETKQPCTLDIAIVMQACPEFASWAHNMGGYQANWNDLHRVAGQLRPMIGISEHAWNVAQDQLGAQIATAALVLVFDKHCAGEVASPGGYLRGMVDKAGAGELHLERSFYGRMIGQAA